MRTPSSSELRKACSNVGRALKECSEAALVHHWDADGVFSAAIIKKALNSEAVTAVPQIGDFSVGAVPDLPGINSLGIVDYGLPKDEVSKLMSYGSYRRVFVIDHHATGLKGDHVCNPVPLGFSEVDYPSTTWVIKELLLPPDVRGDLSINLMVAAGILGDLGLRYVTFPQKGFIESVARESGLTIASLLEAVELVDSCYRLLDRECVSEAVDIAFSEGVEGILRSDFLRGKKELLKGELSKSTIGVKEVLRRDPYLVYELDSGLYITSYVGRELAAENPDKVVVLYHRLKPLNKTYIYVRSQTKHLRDCIHLFRNKGLEVGGKDKVFVITSVIGKEPSINELIGRLRWCVS